VDNREAQLGAIRDKYQRLLVNIELLKNSLAQELPAYDEKSLKQAVDHIFLLATELAKDIREFEVD